jgi:hypothetical protein
VRLKAPQISEELSEELVKTIQELRALDLRKAPSIGRRSTGRSRSWS